MFLTLKKSNKRIQVTPKSGAPDAYRYVA